MLSEIKAMFACDDCGTEFFVPIDPAIVPPAGWSTFELAEDAIRSGQGYEDATDDECKSIGSVENGRHYCQRCTKKMDAKAAKKDSKCGHVGSTRDGLITAICQLPKGHGGSHGGMGCEWNGN